MNIALPLLVAQRAMLHGVKHIDNSEAKRFNESSTEYKMF